MQAFVDGQRGNAQARVGAEIVLSRRQPARAFKQVVAEAHTQHPDALFAKQLLEGGFIRPAVLHDDARGVLLRHLGDFLLQRHASEQIAHALVHGPARIPINLGAPG